jgi:hypothetical protein
VLGFYINQVDEKKFLKKKPKMKKEVKRIVGGEILEQEEITQVTINLLSRTNS